MARLAEMDARPRRSPRRPSPARRGAQPIAAAARRRPSVKLDTSRPGSVTLVRYEEAAPWLRGNPYLRGAYRRPPDTGGTAALVRSLFVWHNETLAIWSHLLGFALLVVLAAANEATPRPRPALQHGLTSHYLGGASRCCYRFLCR